MSCWTPGYKMCRKASTIYMYYIPYPKTKVDHSQESYLLADLICILLLARVPIANVGIQQHLSPWNVTIIVARNNKKYKCKPLSSRAAALHSKIESHVWVETNEYSLFTRDGQQYMRRQLWLLLFALHNVIIIVLFRGVSNGRIF